MWREIEGGGERGGKEGGREREAVGNNGEPPFSRFMTGRLFPVYNYSDNPARADD